MSIKNWIIFLTSSLIIATTIILTFFFYKEFQKTLDERVLLQLSSIQTLKRVQVEAHINDVWVDFKNDINSESNKLLTNFSEKDVLPKPTRFIDSVLTLEKPDGIYDITHYTINKKLSLLLVSVNNDNKYVYKISSPSKIQKIILERTGMGQSGETYIVGNDYHLRTESRFHSKRLPYKILAKTEGINNALKGESGSGVFKDYRNKMVYSVYHKVNFPHLNWAILSEIDVKEVTKPLRKMKMKLIYISFLVLVFIIIISLFLTNKIIQPIQKVSVLINKMAIGQYNIPIEESGIGTEVKQLFHSLIKLQNSINGAIDFANSIGNMALDTKYKTVGTNDPLGESLLMMRDKLEELKLIEEKNQQLTKQSLIKGQENERNRLSKELHDGIGPLLTSMKLMVQSSVIENEKKQDIKNLIDHIIEEIRRMSYDLMPQSLLDFGVGKSIANWVIFLEKSSKIDIQYSNSMEDSHLISQEINICLFRVIQELLNNTIKHAEATEIKLSLTEFDERVSLYFKDNGKGFDQNNVIAGSGLLNIKERIEVLNGFYTINSDKSGTEIEVEIPLNS